MNQFPRCYVLREVPPLSGLWECSQELLQSVLMGSLPIPCEDILTALTEQVNEETLRSRENVVLVLGEDCFIIRRGDPIKAECREAFRVYFVVRPGSVVHEGDLLGFTYSGRGVVRKIKARTGGLIVAVVHDPRSKPERGCAIYHPLETTIG